MKQIKFGFEDLEAWHKAMEFANEVIRLIGILDTDRKHHQLIEQLEGCSTSIALNTAEGKGRYSKKEFVQFLSIARGSLYETITMLIIFNNNMWINNEELERLKVSGDELGKELSSSIKAIKKTCSSLLMVPWRW